MITEPLKTNSGTANHFFSKGCNIKDNNNTKYQNIEEQFVGNYSKFGNSGTSLHQV